MLQHLIKSKRGHRTGLRPSLVLVLTLFCFGAVNWFSPTPAEAAPGAASIAAVIAESGSVEVHRARSAQYVALGLSQSLSAGDVVHTGDGGKVSILFSDGSQVKLGARSSLVITPPTKVKGKTSFFRVLAGEVWARLRPGRAIKTQYANLIVRGTEVLLTVQGDGTTTLTVLEGEVEFFNDLGSVVVEVAQQSTIRPGSAPTRPATIVGPGLTVEWTVDLNRALLPREKFYATLDRAQAANNVIARRKAWVAEDSAANRLQLGDALFDAHRYSESLAQYQAAIAKTPADARLEVRVGYALLAQDQLDAAQAAFGQALATTQQAASRAARALRSPERPQVQAVSWQPPGSDAGPIREVAFGAGDATTARMIEADAYTGRAWVALQRNQPAAAATAAQSALTAQTESAEAHLALGIAWMRQPGHEADAQSELEKVATAQPAAMRYQGEAWLALLALARDDTNSAAGAAAAAVKLQPNSALANAALSMVAFYNGDNTGARRWAHQAARLDPDSVATQLALAQGELADGDTEAAAAAAARAAALDPSLPQAFYVLGVADAQARDYSHATRELKTALRLAPDYMAAAATLARVYVRMGRPAEADTLLASMAAAHGDSTTLLAARGETLYARAKYDEALALYRVAVAAHPDSALTWRGYARLALDANHLNEAIEAGQKAIELAPNVSEYHSVLGLAFSRARLDSQAEREFRSALALDPNNALALVQLGLADSEGDPRITLRTQNLTFVQGFMLDPEVSRDLLHGGIDTEITPTVGNHETDLKVETHHSFDEGRGNLYGRFFTSIDDGARNNADQHTLTGRVDTTYAVSKKATVYVHGLHRHDKDGVPATVTNPSDDDKRSLRFDEGIAVGRFKVGARNSLWVGAFDGNQRTRLSNPRLDGTLETVIPTFLGLAPNVQDATIRNQALDPEIRLDFSLSHRPRYAKTLTIGTARPRVVNTLDQNLVFIVPGTPPFTGNFHQQVIQPTTTIYGELRQQFGSRGSLLVQLRHDRTRYSAIRSGLFLGAPLDGVGTGLDSRLQPSLMLNFRPGHTLLLRVMAGRRITQGAVSILSPVESSLSTETGALPYGVPDINNHGDLRYLQLDAEHYFKGGLLKLFAFNTTARNSTIDVSAYKNQSDTNGDFEPEGSGLSFNRLQRSGLGVRLEKQLSHTLFWQATAVGSHTTARGSLFSNVFSTSVPALFDNQAAPYHPNLTANTSFNYVAPSGIKAGIRLNYASAFYADTDDITATSRPRFGAKTTIDLLLAREPSVHSEISLQIINLLDTRQIVYNDIPFNQRRVIVQYTSRF